MARVNVELKARDSDPQRTLERCVSLGASDEGILVQRDSYFSARRGRLKFREQGKDGSELIAYGRADEFDPTESTYVLAPVAETRPMAEALEYALGSPTVVVSKRRHLFMWEGVRIHLDDVDDLGQFIEFEAVLESPAGTEAIDAAHKKLARLRAELQIGDEDLIEGGYSDLLLEGPPAPRPRRSKSRRS